MVTGKATRAGSLPDAGVEPLRPSWRRSPGPDAERGAGLRRSKRSGPSTLVAKRCLGEQEASDRNQRHAPGDPLRDAGGGSAHQRQATVGPDGVGSDAARRALLVEDVGSNVEHPVVAASFLSTVVVPGLLGFGPQLTVARHRARHEVPVVVVIRAAQPDAVHAVDARRERDPFVAGPPGGATPLGHAALFGHGGQAAVQLVGHVGDDGPKLPLIL